MFDLVNKIAYDAKGLFLLAFLGPIVSSNAEIEIRIGLHVIFWR